MATRIQFEDDIPTQNPWATTGGSEYTDYQRYQQVRDVASYSRANTMQANEYKILDDISHVLEAPGMYIDFMGILMRKDLIFDGQHMVRAEIGTPPAMVRIFIELIANAIDNVSRSRRGQLDPGCIRVSIEPDLISVYNEGMAMCIAMHQDRPDMWIPSANFSIMKASSNFSVERHEIGRNGIGCKAANIMSRRFLGETANVAQGLLFVQEWTNNMRTPGIPSVTRLPPGITTNYTKISYQLDWSRFQYPHRVYTQEMFALVARICADASFTSRVPVWMNDRQFYNPDLLSLSRLYFGEVKNYVLYYVWPLGLPTNIDKNGLESPVDGNTSALVEIAILDTPDKGMHISFVNGLNTPNGGVHLDAALKGSMQYILDSLNGKSGGTKAEEKKKLDEERKKKVAAGISIIDDKSKKKENVIKITKADVRQHISIIVSVRITDPDFDSQSKTMLRSPKIKIDVPKEKLQCMSKWEVTEKMKNVLHSRQMMKLKSTDGKKTRVTKCDKAEDANLSGTKDSQDCTLIVTEGESAKTEARTIASLHPRGRDVIGILALRGKIRNAIKATPEELAANAEITNLKDVLGLREMLDYTNPTNRATLRYGSIMIMTDQDDDGMHIKGLILAYFFRYYPSLYAIGFVMDFRTPRLRVSKGGVVVRFFNEQEYQAWRKTVSDPDSWLHKYFKGLGSAKKEEVKDDFDNPNIVTYYLDENTLKVIEMAFGEKHANDRKAWISNYNPNIPKPPASKKVSVSSFILYEMIDYPISCLKRAIPRLDGQKESQRKCLYAICKKFNMKVGVKPQKIGTLAANTVEVTNYHHGDSLPDVITLMAYDFVGSNNLPYFGRESALGTRIEGGKDAAQPRYTFTNLNWWIPLMYRDEDKCILDLQTDEGETVEPEVMYPILPMHLINGINGVAVAWKTFMPCHHPLDVAYWYMHRIAFSTGNAPSPPNSIKPWYRNYLANDDIQIMDKRRTKMDVANDTARKEWMIQNGINPNAKYEDRNYHEGEQMGIIFEDFEDDTSIVGEKVVISESADASKISDMSQNIMNMILTPSNPIHSVSSQPQMKVSVAPTQNVENPDQRVTGTGRFSMVTSGKFHWDYEKRVLVVTELPIGLWTMPYENWLKQLRKEKLITDFRTRSTDDNVYFEIDNFRPTLGDPNIPRIAENGDTVVTARDLQLIRSYGLTTLILLDERGHPRVFTDVKDVLEYFYHWRLSIYERRRQKMIQNLKTKATDLEGRIRFVQSVLARKIRLFYDDGSSRPIDELFGEADALNLPRKHLKTQSDAYTKEKYAKLVAEYQKLLAEIKALEQTDPRTIWMAELQEFVTEYNKHYKNDKFVKTTQKTFYFDGKKTSTRRPRKGASQPGAPTTPVTTPTSNSFVFEDEPVSNKIILEE